MSTDYDSYAVVWSCRPIDENTSNETFWVLARTSTISGNTQTRVNSVLTTNGALFDQLRETEQNLEVCMSNRS